MIFRDKYELHRIVDSHLVVIISLLHYIQFREEASLFLGLYLNFFFIYVLVDETNFIISIIICETSSSFFKSNYFVSLSSWKRKWKFCIINLSLWRYKKNMRRVSIRLWKFQERDGSLLEKHVSTLQLKYMKTLPVLFQLWWCFRKRLFLILIKDLALWGNVFFSET